MQLKSEKLGLVEIFGEGLSGFLSGALDEVLSRALSRPGDDITAPRAEPEPSVALEIPKACTLLRLSRRPGHSQNQIFDAYRGRGWIDDGRRQWKNPFKLLR